LGKALSFSAVFDKAAVVALEGDLGSGKTHFVQGFAKHLGIKEKITSPTFVILKRFKTGGAKIRNLIHIDAYRIEKPEEIFHDRGFYPYVIGGGPTEHTFIDGLKKYETRPGVRYLTAFFSCAHWMDLNLQAALKAMKGFHGVIILTLETQIIAACHIRETDSRKNQSMAFLGRVVLRGHKDEFMAGIYRTQDRNGFCDIFRDE
ncbi:MAG: tRNA (adenosine(37)-N6)-threonylcarbamoyltransferase complex ATPase subunit type 1 TsaE, partial [Patescibacteria group bacterium]